MPAISIVIKHLRPFDAVDLGRLVLSIQGPQQDFYEPKSLPKQVSVQRLENFSELLNQVKGFKLHGFLSATLNDMRQEQLPGDEGRVYESFEADGQVLVYLE